MSNRCVYAPRTLISSLVCAHTTLGTVCCQVGITQLEMVADEGVFHDHGGHDVACHCRTSGAVNISL